MAAIVRAHPSMHSTDTRMPPLTQSDAVTSLLSLGLAAAASAQQHQHQQEQQLEQQDIVGSHVAIPIRPSLSTGSTTTSIGSSDSVSPGHGLPGSLGTPTTAVGATPASVDNRAITVGPTPTTAAAKHHRRLGSTGKTRRRLSDAREASARPILVSPGSSSSGGLLSLASLSLSTSTSPGNKPLAPRPAVAGSVPSGISISALSGSAPIPVVAVTSDHGVGLSVSAGSTATDAMSVHAEDNKDKDKDSMDESHRSTPIPISGNGKMKKRGVDYKCESCAKIYRHPNCLNKHRWEHTRQWREASKFVLSKHQQVQLLEAAAILSFMGTNSTSLPEDRSEWPSFLSGGSLPKADAVMANANSKVSTSVSSVSSANVVPVPPAVAAPAPMAIGAPNKGNGYGLRTSHPISSSVPARMSSSGPRLHDYTLPVTATATAAAMGTSSRTSTRTRAGAAAAAAKAAASAVVAVPNAGVVIQGSGWTIPSSSVRSESSGSGSRSGYGSGSRSGSESEEELDVDVEIMDTDAVADGVRDGDERKMPGPVNVRIGYGSYGTFGTPVGGHGAGYHMAGYGIGAHAVGPASFGVRRAGGMKEEDEMSVGFSVREEDEDEEDTMSVGTGVGGRQSKERRWDGMEMEVDMDMD